MAVHTILRHAGVDVVAIGAAADVADLEVAFDEAAARGIALALYDDVVPTRTSIAAMHWLSAYARANGRDPIWRITGATADPAVLLAPTFPVDPHG